jgi:hypothetical protein
MPGRTLNRRELRKQADLADEPSPPVPDPEAAPVRKPRAARAKAPRTKAKAPRLRARWGVYDGGMKQVAIFDYNQRAAAEEKVAELLGKKKGVYFLQLVKEPIPEEEPAEVPSVA